uniref:Uncharacterized protein n=1 Tax=Xylaria hypoxylon TaxID=37992 RepID=A0A6G6D9K0_9PEZI|nr:hypothetical protein [Xylaria hypoxylon]QIE13216.1 hypothetical protein [Xylaria hypoxylon]
MPLIYNSHDSNAIRGWPCKRPLILYKMMNQMLNKKFCCEMFRCNFFFKCYFSQSIQLDSKNIRFYSTSLPFRSPDKLFINSTPDNIVFMHYDDNIQRSVLILPSLKPFIALAGFQVLVSKESLLKEKELKMKLELEMKDLQIALSKIMCYLKSGCYKFEFYLYFDDLMVNSLIIEAYTYDFFNKNELNKLICSYGYFTFSTIIGCLDNSKDVTSRRYFFTKVCTALTLELDDMFADDEKFKSIIKLNKGTLLVISKSTKEEVARRSCGARHLGALDKKSNYNKPSMGGIKLGENKRFYSTSLPTKFSSRHKVKLGVRSLSYTQVKLAQCGCGCGKDFLTSKEKQNLKKYAEEYASENSLPALSKAQTEKLKNENYADLAAAYKDDYIGLIERKKGMVEAFKKLNNKFDVYFTKKENFIKDKIKEAREIRSKQELCEEKLDVFIKKNYNADNDKVSYRLLLKCDEATPLLNRLSRDIYIKYKHSESTHAKAERLIKGNKDLIEKNGGSPNHIDKDLFKNGLSVNHPDFKDNSDIPSSAEKVKATNDTKNTENSSIQREVTSISNGGTNKETKRSFEEISQLSNDKGKRIKISDLLNKKDSSNDPSNDKGKQIKISDLLNKKDSSNDPSNDKGKRIKISDLLNKKDSSNDPSKVKFNTQIPDCDPHAPYKKEFVIAYKDFEFPCSIKVPSIKVPSIKVPCINMDDLVRCIEPLIGCLKDIHIDYYGLYPCVIFIIKVIIHLIKYEPMWNCFFNHYVVGPIKRFIGNKISSNKKSNKYKNKSNSGKRFFSTSSRSQSVVHYYSDDKPFNLQYKYTPDKVMEKPTIKIKGRGSSSSTNNKTSPARVARWVRPRAAQRPWARLNKQFTTSGPGPRQINEITYPLPSVLSNYKYRFRRSQAPRAPPGTPRNIEEGSHLYGPGALRLDYCILAAAEINKNNLNFENVNLRKYLINRLNKSSFLSYNSLLIQPFMVELLSKSPAPGTRFNIKDLNLEWKNIQERSVKNTRPKKVKIVELSTDKNIDEFVSQTECGKFLNVSETTIRKRLKNKTTFKLKDLRVYLQEG